MQVQTYLFNQEEGCNNKLYGICEGCWTAIQHMFAMTGNKSSRLTQEEAVRKKKSDLNIKGSQEPLSTLPTQGTSSPQWQQ